MSLLSGKTLESDTSFPALTSYLSAPTSISLPVYPRASKTARLVREGENKLTGLKQGTLQDVLTLCRSLGAPSCQELKIESNSTVDIV